MSVEDFLIIRASKSTTKMLFAFTIVSPERLSDTYSLRRVADEYRLLGISYLALIVIDPSVPQPSLEERPVEGGGPSFLVLTLPA